MKKIFAAVLFISCFLLSSGQLFSQLLYEENFDYPAGDTLLTHGWFAHSQQGVNAVMVTAGSLTYPGYPSSGIGNMVTAIGGSGSREDVNDVFAIDSAAGVIYTSMLINVVSAGTTQEYFFHMRPDPSSAILRGRIFVRDDGSGNLNIGLSKQSTSTINWSSASYSFGTTYLLVLKYIYVAGDDNDIWQLYINPPLTGSEPAAPDLENLDTNTDIIANSIAIRQGSNPCEVQVDGIRVSHSWNWAPLPVELTSFTYRTRGSNVLLNWSTATEINNLGFEVQRKSDNNGFVTIGFVEGAGTTPEKMQYSFSDEELESGYYSYRLKQIDSDGSFEYSNAIEVVINGPVQFALDQNYPNPFNPATTIKYQISENSLVSLKVYDILGNEVAILVDETQEAGSYEISFIASSLSSGVYFYRIEAGGFSAMKKMSFVK
jgi:hypothetical protein